MFGQSFEITLAGGDQLSSRKQVCSAIPELAFAQIFLGSPSNAVWRRKCVNNIFTKLSSLTKAIPERRRDLANMRHLLHRRTNECRQTFPLRLPDDPQTATKIASGFHDRIVRKRCADLR